MVRVAINGYGRIGRVAHRIILEKYSDRIEVVGINTGSTTDLQGWLYLLKYDSAYGPLRGHSLSIEPSEKHAVSPEGEKERPHFQDFLNTGHFVIDEQKIPIFAEKDASVLPWKSLKVDVVIESTGHLRSEEKLNSHLQAGAKKVVLSAPAKEGNIQTVVLSVNEKDYVGGQLISNASCTTNCITPVAQVMHNAFGIEKAMMTTIHAYTSDQKLQDSGHADYRRARAAGQNIIPTTTGATSAAAKAMPELSDALGGLAVRVPVITGSLSDFTFLLKKDVTKDEVNAAFEQASQKDEYRGILRATNDPLVSSDVIGDSHSAIIDLSLTQVIGGNMVKVIAWYDNEYGYANRLVEEVLMVGEN